MTTINPKSSGYGWIPDLPDARDFRYSSRFLLYKGKGILPIAVDLREKCPPVYDQGELGSCTANAIGAAHQFEQMKQNAKKAFIPSRLFIYYNERLIEGTITVDSGAMLRDGIKSVVSQGVCQETLWPYNIKAFTKKPGSACYKEAEKHQVLRYERLNTVAQMKDCLAAGFPFVFGFSVYESFERPITASTGKVIMPNFNRERLLGGHAVMCVGYSEQQGTFTVRNSWGNIWGDKGYCYFPYAYLSNRNLSDDFWTIKMVEE